MGATQANESIESTADQVSDATKQAGAKVNDTARDAAASAEGATDGVPHFEAAMSPSVNFELSR